MTDSRARSLLVLCALFCLLAVTVAVSASARPLSQPHTAVAFAASTHPQALMSAAHSSTRSDRRLVADARKLKRCLHAHRTHPARCAATRRALQRAGIRLRSAEQHLARIARTSGRTISAHSASHERSPRTAPRLLVAGDELKWTRIDGLDSYVLVRKVPGEAKQYSVIDGTTVTPPPVPGTTVRYSIRTTAAMSAWATEQAIAYPSANHSAPGAPSAGAGAGAGASSPPIVTADPQAAPQITVSGEELSWNAIAGVSTYVLVRSVPGQAPQYSEVGATTVTPTAVPGVTARYSVRTAVEGSAWAAEVAIAYAASPTVPPVSTPPTPTPPVEESPSSPPSGSAVFQPGINAGWVYPGQLDLPAATELGAKLVRVEFPIEWTVAQLEPTIAGYAEIGIRVAPLATFASRIPTPAEAQHLASWAEAYGPGGTFWAARNDGQLAIQTIEFGNETEGAYQYGDGPGDASYTARAQLYAVRLEEAAEAVTAGGVHVGLLAVSDDPTGDWMDGMFSAVPNLGDYVGGWVSHPYGDHWKSALEDVVNQAAAHGAPSSIPIDITEWGLASDNGRCLTENYGWNPCMSDQEAGETMNTVVAGIRQLLGGRLGMFILYQIRDQKPTGVTNEREAYFGALQHENQSKGAYTAAVKALLASS